MARTLVCASPRGLRRSAPTHRACSFHSPLSQARTAARTASQASRSMHTTAARQGGHGGDYVRVVFLLFVLVSSPSP